jgi:hypothetical protein
MKVDAGIAATALALDMARLQLDQARGQHPAMTPDHRAEVVVDLSVAAQNLLQAPVAEGDAS